MTYEQFERSNNMSKQMGVMQGRVIGFNNKMNVCRLQTHNSISDININILVKNIMYDGNGCLSNPSAIKNWKGWRR